MIIFIIYIYLLFYIIFYFYFYFYFFLTDIINYKKKKKNLNFKKKKKNVNFKKKKVYLYICIVGKLGTNNTDIQINFFFF